ncbi:hypothetical protein [Massilia sp. erpn]|uniref:hypothetical protein n=1 Tax=Massilia sp. erpn TaxID=2738142 RepID=UPI0021042439|nr:hypothetical protein [Massilia sp. erpn]UTY55875.1 hypothetical protein HPQ68_00940 [Massilia sp. erpn]
MTIANEVLTDAAARDALRQLDHANQLAQQSMAEDRLPSLVSADQAIQQAADEARIQLLRNRAKRQRDRGIQGLARRHDGVASMIRTVELQERVVGSAFERYYASIEHGIHFIVKLGGFFVGDANAEKLLDTIKEKIAEMEGRIRKEASQIALVLEAHAENAEWIRPEYSNPAARHTVQIRTPLANRVATAFLLQDRYLQNLNQLVWNGEADGDDVEQTEYQIKKEVRDLAQFIARTLRGIQNKTEVKEPAPTAASQLATAPAVA